MFKNFARHGKVVLYRLLIRCIGQKKKSHFNTVSKKRRTRQREKGEKSVCTDNREDLRVGLRMDLMRFVRMYLRA
jgi:hypothetical protein